MFIETYYDERSGLPAGSGEKAIPYPELVGEELILWQKYLPVRTEIENAPFWLRDNMPRLVTEQLEKARKAPSLFEHIEIWSRSGDPMAVGVIGGEPERYFSIARWGDAKLTLEQVKRRLRVKKWFFRLLPVAMFLIFLVGTVVVITYAGHSPEVAQKALSHGELFGY